MTVPEVTNDVSINSILITGAIAVAGYLLRGGAKLLVLAIETLVKKLVETIAKVETLDANIKHIFEVLATVEKNKNDLNEYFKRLKNLEDEFQKLKQ